MSFNVVDSSGWLEYFSKGSNVDFFRAALKDKKNLIIPAVCVYEVCKVIRLREGESAANLVAVSMQEGIPVPLALELALTAAKISAERKLAMADAMIAATAQAFDATLWTQDADFKDFPNVKFKAKK